MAKRKKYVFSDKDKQVTLKLEAYSDKEAFEKLGSIVQKIAYFTNMRVYKMK